MKRLENKIALVTGAVRGIGLACVKLFIEEGASVIMTDLQDDLGEKEAKQLGCDYQHLDVSDEDKWKRLEEYIREEYGYINILVNNAGITDVFVAGKEQNPENFDIKVWDKIQSVNNDGVALGCKYGIRLIKGHVGSIVNISSRSGIVGIPHSVSYAASKAAVRNHTKSVALYCAEMRYNIRCNSVHPAAIYTPIWDDMLPQKGEGFEEAVEGIKQGIPLGKMGEPIDVAYAVVFLSSDESKYITGAELNVDGGILAGSSASPKKR